MPSLPTRTSRSHVERQILDLVATGEARSRSDLVRLLGVAASTVSLRVQKLADDGLLEEVGEGESSGGRRPRLLRAGNAGYVLAVDFGGSHAKIGRLDLAATLVKQQSLKIDVTAGPEKTLAQVCEVLRSWIGEQKVQGVGVSLPGPVDILTGTVIKPSRMPGWAGFEVRTCLEQHLGLPVTVDNDANLMALGEHRAQFGIRQHSITVKAGTAIGSGVIIDGRIHHGATFSAGDITHVRVAEDGMPCSCGNIGCLETIASGAGILRQLRERGISVSDTAQLMQLAHDADPEAITLVRTAGSYLGRALAGVMNFFNPHAVFLTGAMSSLEPFLAAVRSQIYEDCHPLATTTLRIEAATTGADAGLYGAARQVIDELRYTAIR